MELSNKTIDILATAPNCNPIAVKKVAYELAERIDELEMETRTEADLMIAYLEEIIIRLKTEFENE